MDTYPTARGCALGRNGCPGTRPQCPLVELAVELGASRFSSSSSVFSSSLNDSESPVSKCIHLHNSLANDRALFYSLLQRRQYYIVLESLGPSTWSESCLEIDGRFWKFSRPYSFYYKMGIMTGLIRMGIIIGFSRFWNFSSFGGRGLNSGN